MTRAALLDVDGTLVDSNDAHARAYVEAFAAFGRGDVTFDDVRPLIGMGGDQLVPKLLDARLPDADAAFLRDLAEDVEGEKHRVFEAYYLPQLKPFPGARGLVEAIRLLGWTVVVASSGSAADVDAILRQAGLADLLPVRTSADDARCSKPHPDIVTAALGKAGVPGGDALLVGDTPYDVVAGNRAGVRVVALRTGGWSDEALKDALMIYDGPGDLADDFRTLAEPPKLSRVVGDF